MAAVCEVCGKHPSFGMSVSHSHRRTKRRWNPNIQRVRAVVNGSHQARQRLHRLPQGRQGHQGRPLTVAPARCRASSSPTTRSSGDGVRARRHRPRRVRPGARRARAARCSACSARASGSSSTSTTRARHARARRLRGRHGHARASRWSTPGERAALSGRLRAPHAPPRLGRVFDVDRGRPGWLPASTPSRHGSRSPVVHRAGLQPRLIPPPGAPRHARQRRRRSHDRHHQQPEAARAGSTSGRQILQPDDVTGATAPPRSTTGSASCWSTAAPSERSNDAKRPNSYLALSDPGDVARVEDRTFICSEHEIDAGPTNNWRAPAEMKDELLGLYRGAMKGRTMYVVPFSMGPLGSPIAHIGVQLTDSRLRGRQHADHDPHGPGRPRRARATASSCRACTRSATRSRRRRHHAPTCRGRATPRTSTSSTSPRPARSGPTAPATAATPCSARSASPCASPRPWPATTAGWPSTCSSSASPRPSGEKRYVAAAFPSACGKTNMAMLIPTLPGLEGRDRRRRHRLDEVRRRRPALRHQPRGRLLRRRPRHRRRRPTPTPSHTLRRQLASSPTCAQTDDGDVWWEGLTDEPPAHLIDWKGNDWTPESGTPGRPPQRPLHRPGVAVPVDRPRVGGPRRACRSRPSSSAAAAPPTSRW